MQQRREDCNCDNIDVQTIVIKDGPIEQGGCRGVRAMHCCSGDYTEGGSGVRGPMAVSLAEGGSGVWVDERAALPLHRLSALRADACPQRSPPQTASRQELSAAKVSKSSSALTFPGRGGPSRSISYGAEQKARPSKRDNVHRCIRASCNASLDADPRMMHRRG